MSALSLYDTTLRDGCQSEDVNLTLEDKLRITERLDALGVRYVEGGWPGSNPRDEEYFRRVKALRLSQASRVTTCRRPGRSLHARSTLRATARVRQGETTRQPTFPKMNCATYTCSHSKLQSMQAQPP